MQALEKPWYLSKMFWTNLIMGVVLVVFPSLKETITEEVLVSVFATVNIILRLFFTDTKITVA